MAITRDEVERILAGIAVPGGGTLVSHDLVRALTIADDQIRLVIEVPDAATARTLEPARQAAVAALEALPGVRAVSAVMTAPTAGTSPPKLRIGGHARPAPPGPQPVPGVARILAVASGKGGVGKSTVSSNLAVALARQGRRVGLLDADIHGPSQPRMMGVNQRPASPDGKRILPLTAHGVTMMSIGLMLKEGDAVIWRGPMLMGALQQMMEQVVWGELDVLVIDLPPGTGDVQLSLCQRYPVTGAVIVSTPQDVALIDARKAMNMFDTLKVPVVGLIENMSFHVCPACGHQEHIFGHGGVRAEAARLDLPFLGEIPLALAVRQAGDAGTPIAAAAGPGADAAAVAVADAYARIAADLVAAGYA